MKRILLLLIEVSLVAAAQSQSWNITGNAGTNPSIHFLGTTDNQPLKFRVNNVPSGEINQTNGKVTLGYYAGYYGTPTYSVAIGHMAAYGNIGYENTAVGAFALYGGSNSGYNVAMGYSALYSNTTGNTNTAIGYASMLQNTAGYNNVAYGSDAMRLNTYGNFNTAIGTYALRSTTGSQYNTAVGYMAGYSYDLGYNNTILGANCGGSFAGQYNIIAIGQGVTCPGNSTARIGNSATVSIGGYVGWSNFSDGRFKKDVQENVKGLDFIMKLRPVTYRLDITGLSKQLKENNNEDWTPQMKTAIARKEKMVLTGFVAQEVEQAAAETGYDFNGVDKPETKDGFYALRYAEFVVPLVKAVQEQQKIIDDLKKRLTEMEKKTNPCLITMK